MEIIVNENTVLKKINPNSVLTDVNLEYDITNYTTFSIRVYGGYNQDVRVNLTITLS